MGMKATAQVRSNLAVHHLMAAAYSARKVAELERIHAGEPFGEFFSEIMWNVTGTVFFAVAALEADVNEIFIDYEVNFPGHDRDFVNKIWELMEMKGILEKYDLALFLRTKQRLDKGVASWNDADGLIKLRNLLVHFKPEWSHEQVEHAKIEKRLERKFELSPFLPVGDTFFPKRVMSHGCAAWAVKTAVAFRDAFSATAGIDNRFEPFRSRLQTQDS